MAILLIFLLGIGNFAMHRAVVESRHPLLRQLPWFVHLLGGRVGLFSEFLVLLAAMLLVANEHPGWGVAYLAYSLFNALAAWLIITRRL
jgi:inner membrane protein involved in colicin E2 resistance